MLTFFIGLAVGMFIQPHIAAIRRDWEKDRPYRDWSRFSDPNYKGF